MLSTSSLLECEKGITILAIENKSHLSSKFTVCCLFFILLFGIFRRYDSFNETGLWPWNFDLPYYVYKASHLSEGSLYTIDKRAVVAYRNRRREIGLHIQKDFFYPFQKDERILSQYGEKPVLQMYLFSDTGLIFLFWTAFKLFGEATPFLSMWKLQFIVDALVILFLFFAARMLLGSMVGLLASFLYAWFPFVHQNGHPIYFPVQTPFYYFWMIPFTVLSLLFWGYIHRYGISLQQKPLRYYLLFIFYGIFTGCFSMVRSTLLLTIPFVGLCYFFVVMGELKKKLVLGILLALLFQALTFLPILAYNKKMLGSYKLTDELFWGTVFSGIGFYQNPYGIIHHDDFLIQFVRMKCGIKEFSLSNPTSLQIRQTVDPCLKNEVIGIWEKTPRIFFANAMKNFYYAFLLAPRTDLIPPPSGKSLMGDFNLNRLTKPFYSLLYVVLLFLGFGYVFLFEREALSALTLILSIGLYLVLSVCVLTPPQTYYITGYYPVFYLLIAWGFLSFLQMVFQRYRRFEKFTPGIS